MTVAEFATKFTHLVSSHLNPKWRYFYKFYFLYLLFGRYKKMKLTFLGFNLEIVDTASFIWQYKEMFIDNHYQFSAKAKNPIIYDCGANIGLSSLYFARQYPTAKIKAFEADPQLARVINSNLTSNKARNVTVSAKAIWIKNGTVEFRKDKADRGSIVASESSIKVKSVRLRDLIKREKRVDMLKMDIEGAEVEVLEDCKSELKKIQNLFVELHLNTNNYRHLEGFLRALNANDFRYYFQNVNVIKNPLLNLSKMHMQVNVYATRH